LLTADSCQLIAERTPLIPQVSGLKPILDAPPREIRIASIPISANVIAARILPVGFVLLSASVSFGQAARHCRPREGMPRPPRANCTSLARASSVSCSIAGNHGKILLESPESVVLLPEGEYRWESVTLQGNGGTTFSAGNSRRQWDTRDARSTAIMNVGGPLEPLLTVDEGRGKLILMHKLRGIDGELYLADRFSVHP